MTMLATSLGIEISGKDLRIAVLRSVFGKLRFVNSFEIPGFTDLSPEEQKASLAQSIERHKLPYSRVFLSLPHDRGIVRQLEFPVEVRDKLRSAVALQLETLCPWPVEEIYWDFVEEPSRKGAKTTLVTVTIIPRPALDSWVEFFKSIHLPLSGASLSAVSAAHGVRSLWADDRPTVLIACEDSYVEASLVQGNRLTSITTKAEDKNGAIKTALDRLFSLGRVSTPSNCRLVAFGSNAGLLEGVERVALPIENSKLENTDRFGAISTALAGLKKSAFDTNLIPRNLRYRQNQLQLIPAYVLIALALLLGMGIALREPYQTSVYASQLDSEIRKIAPEVKEVSSQEAELNKLSEKYRALIGHIQARDQNLEAMKELSRGLPPTAWLTNYAYQDGAITVSGFAASASEVQKALEDTALFKDVQFTTSVTRDSSGKDRFTLKGSLEAQK